eukprot:970670-Rhodomonas_salina.2
MGLGQFSDKGPLGMDKRAQYQGLQRFLQLLFPDMEVSNLRLTFILSTLGVLPQSSWIEMPVCTDSVGILLGSDGSDTNDRNESMCGSRTSLEQCGEVETRADSGGWRPPGARSPSDWHWLDFLFTTVTVRNSTLRLELLV